MTCVQLVFTDWDLPLDNKISCRHDRTLTESIVALLIIARNKLTNAGLVNRHANVLILKKCFLTGINCSLTFLQRGIHYCVAEELY